MNSPTENVPLNMQTIQNIGKAYARLIELREQKVLTINTEAEVKGLIEYLSSELLAHTNELLACWLVAKTEYEVLLNVFAKVIMHIDAIKAAHPKSNIVIKPMKNKDSSNCPKCGQSYETEKHAVYECPSCGVSGSTACCNPGGNNCLCAECENSSDDEDEFQ